MPVGCGGPCSTGDWAAAGRCISRASKAASEHYDATRQAYSRELVPASAVVTAIALDMIAKIHRSLQEVDMAPEAWAPVLLHLLGLQEGTDALAALSPEARKARTLTTLTQMCLNGSHQRPLILEIEDLHWIDASSDECLAALVERMAGAPLLGIVFGQFLRFSQKLGQFGD